jgi:hypothetical protein
MAKKLKKEELEEIRHDLFRAHLDEGCFMSPGKDACSCMAWAAQPESALRQDLSEILAAMRSRGRAAEAAQLDAYIRKEILEFAESFDCSEVYLRTIRDRLRRDY